MSEQRTAQPRSLAFGVARSRADKGHKSPPRVVSCANLADLSRALASRFVTSGCFALAAFGFPAGRGCSLVHTPSGVRWPATVLRRRVLFSRAHAQSPLSQSQAGPQPDGSLCKLCAPWPDVQLGLAAAASGRWRRGSLQQSGSALSPRRLALGSLGMMPVGLDSESGAGATASPGPKLKLGPGLWPVQAHHPAAEPAMSRTMSTAASSDSGASSA
jgi:hypothetical protein